MADGRAQQVARLFAGHVDNHRTRNRVAGHERQRIGRGGCAAAEIREQRTRILFSRQLQQAASRNAARFKHIARPIEEADDANARLAVAGGHLVGERAADSPEPKQHDICRRRRLRPASADLGQLECGMHGACGLSCIGSLHSE